MAFKKNKSKVSLQKLDKCIKHNSEVVQKLYSLGKIKEAEEYLSLSNIEENYYNLQILYGNKEKYQEMMKNRIKFNNAINEGIDKFEQNVNDKPFNI